VQRGRFRTAATASAAVAGVLVLAACAAGTSGGAGPSTVHAPRPSSSAPAAPESSTPAGGGGLADPNLATASAVADALLAGIPLPAGGRRQSDRPAGVPVLPGAVSPANDRIVRTGWLVAPGTAAQATAFLQAHPAPGLRYVGASTEAAGASPGLQFSGGGGSGYASRSAVLRVFHLADGVAIQAAVTVVWTVGAGSGAGSGAVPADANSVQLRVIRRTAAEVSRTVSGAAAQHLLQVVNAQQVSPPGTVRCLIDSGMRDELTFRTPTVSVQVIVRLDPCGSVQAGTQGLLSGQTEIDGAVLDALGLPPQYGH
jgi:hypothetical protein